MNKASFKVEMARVRTRVDVTRETLSHARTGVPWTTPEVRIAFERAAESLSALTAALESHEEIELSERFAEADQLAPPSNFQGETVAARIGSATYTVHLYQGTWQGACYDDGRCMPCGVFGDAKTVEDACAALIRHVASKMPESRRKARSITSGFTS